MTYEGTLREAAFEKEQYRSLMVYGILRREWSARSAPPADGTGR